MSRSFEYFLSNSQWIDVPALGMPGALGKLKEALGSAAANTPGASVQVIPGRKRNRVALIAGLFTLVLAGSLSAYFWSSSHHGAKAPASAAITDKSIAVLPFTDMSEKHDQEYFADGITEEVLDRLAQVPGLKVVGRASSFQFKGKSADPAAIATALGVAYLLEGSVRKEAGRVRVTAALVDARTGAQRWSDRVDSDLLEVLKVQDTIAAGIARALQVTMEVDAAPRSSVKSPEALDAYLRGLQSLDHVTRESCEVAVANFRKALDIDPTFARAAIGLAKAYTFLGQEGWLPTPVAFERAREAALVAQQSDPKSPQPHLLLALVHTIYDWDWASADRELQQAFTLAPRDAYGAQVASELAAALDRRDDAQQLANEAIALDPLDPTEYWTLGFNVYLHSGRYAEAEQSFRRMLEIAPKYGSGHYALGLALMLQGRRDEALAEFSNETVDDGNFEGHAMVYFTTQRKAESDAALAEAIRHNGTSWPSEIARVHAFRGEKDRAFEWLDRAYEARDEDLYVIKGDPIFKNLEGDPRYKAFLKKMNLPE